MLFEVFADGLHAAGFGRVVAGEHEHASAFDRFVILMVRPFTGDEAIEFFLHRLADDVSCAAGDQPDALHFSVADHFHRNAQLFFERLTQLLSGLTPHLAFEADELPFICTKNFRVFEADLVRQRAVVAKDGVHVQRQVGGIQRNCRSDC